MSDFTLGEHAARIANIERDVAAIRRDVSKLVLADASRRGAWKMAALIGGGVGSALALAVKFMLGVS